MKNGVCTVVIRGTSYLDAVAAEKGGRSDCKPINLEGGDSGIRRVLNHHGVSLSACLHTFDVMQARNGWGRTMALLDLTFALRWSFTTTTPTRLDVCFCQLD